MKQIIPITIAVVVAAVLVSTMLAPIIADTNDTYTTPATLHNTGLSLVKADPSAEIALFWDDSEPAQLTIGGDTIITYTPAQEGPTFFAGGGDWLLALYDGKLTLAYAEMTDDIYTWDSSDVELTFDDGTCTVTEANETPFTFSYDSIYYPGDGDYVYADISGNVLVKKTTDMLGYIMPVEGTAFEYSGTIVTGDMVTLNAGDTDSHEMLDRGYEGTNYKDVCKLTDLTAGITPSGDTIQDAPFQYVIVPATIQAEEIHHLPVISDILGVVPVIVVLGLIIGCVGLFVSRRM